MEKSENKVDEQRIELEKSPRENAVFKKFLAGQEVNTVDQKESELLKRSGKVNKEGNTKRQLTKKEDISIQQEPKTVGNVLIQLTTSN